MWKDPIVEEVRAAGRHLAEEAGNDLHQFCEKLRQAQARHGQGLVQREPRRIAKPANRWKQ